jgi:hypothetical protein
MKYAFAVTILITATGFVYSQQTVARSSQCSAKLAQSPAVRGIKLGMTLDDVLVLFPGSREDAYIKNEIANVGSYSGIDTLPRFGVVNFSVIPAQYSTKQKFAGIESLSFTFLDDRLVVYSVQYSRPPWPRLDEFVDKVAGAFDLPAADKWTSENAQRKSLECDGFRLQAFTRDGRAGLILRTGADPVVTQRERRAAAEAEARREFRP